MHYKCTLCVCLHNSHALLCTLFVWSRQMNRPLQWDYQAARGEEVGDGDCAVGGLRTTVGGGDESSSSDSKLQDGWAGGVRKSRHPYEQDSGLTLLPSPYFTASWNLILSSAYDYVAGSMPGPLLLRPPLSTPWDVLFTYGPV